MTFSGSKPILDLPVNAGLRELKPMDIALESLRATAAKFAGSTDNHTVGIVFGLNLAIEAIERGMARDAARA